MLLIILHLEKVLRRCKEEKFKAEVFYWLGLLYFKMGDLLSAKGKLMEALALNQRHERARALLGYIWNFRMRPTWWQWWFCSPRHLRRWQKIVGGCVIMLLLGVEVFVLLLYSLSWQAYSLLTGILVFSLLSPLLRRFKIGPLEVDIEPPIEFEPRTLPITMELSLRELEKWNHEGKRTADKKEED